MLPPELPDPFTVTEWPPALGQPRRLADRWPTACARWARSTGGRARPGAPYARAATVERLPDAARFGQVAGRLAPGAVLLRAWPLTRGARPKSRPCRLGRRWSGRTVIVRHMARPTGAPTPDRRREFRLRPAQHGGGLPVPDRSCSTTPARFSCCPTPRSNTSRASRTSPRQFGGCCTRAPRLWPPSTAWTCGPAGVSLPDPTPRPPPDRSAPARLDNSIGKGRAARRWTPLDRRGWNAPGCMGISGRET